MFNGSEEKLFAKSVPISIKDEYTNQSRTSRLFLTIEWQDASAMMYSKKVLSVSLTDENDPFFLYTLNLSEEEFQSLKRDQDLRINFIEFPQHIIAYINKCLDEEKHPQPKFLLVFALNEKLGNAAYSPKFDIIETNQFKNLTYLSLKFNAATESAVRQYITTCFRDLKESKQQLHNKYVFLEQDLTNKLANYQQTLYGKDQALELLRKQKDVELSEKDTKHAKELQEERNRSLNRLKEQESRFERERSENDLNFRLQIQELESKATSFEELNKELEAKNTNLQSTITSLRLNNISLEDKIKKLEETVQSFTDKYKSACSEIESKNLKIQVLEERENDLQGKVLDTERSIKQLITQLQNEKEQTNKLENKLDFVQRQYDSYQRSLRNAEKDKEELNSQVLNLQDKIKKLKSKMQTDANYKLLNEEKEKVLQDIKKETLDLNCLIGAKNAEIRSLNGMVSSLKQDIDHLEKELHTKENVITYLNRQLTENYIIPQTLPPSTSPSIIAQKELAKIGTSATKKLSSSPSNNSPALLSNKTTTKSVRITTPSQNGQKTSSTPSRFHRTEADSAYYTNPSGLATQMTPETFPNPNKPVTAYENKISDFDLDPEALSGAFGNSNPMIKHSTAKKPTKPAKSTPSRTLKKR